MKKKLHSNHIIFRCGSLIALMLISFKANAQIIYTDIVPDYTSENLYESYDLDLNNDQVVDYIISSGIYDFSYLQIVGTNYFNSINSATPWFNHPVPFNSGDVIGQNTYDEYYIGGYLIIENCFSEICYNEWINQQDKYLGLRFLINGSTHYGWARMDVTSYIVWTIKDYAYNATPNAPIMAGQMVLDVEEYDLEKLKVIVSNRQISILNLPDRTEFNLYAINGQKLLHGYLDRNNKYIDVNTIKSGPYIIELIAHNSASTMKRKIIVP